MRNRFFLFVITMTFIIGTLYGVQVHRNQVFPYHFIKLAYRHLISDDGEVSPGPWSIGIYEGDSPFELTPSVDISNPVLTAENVSDRDADFVADPFMVIRGENYYMFFEVMDRSTNQGDIGYAESVDGKNWVYKKIVLDEPFHLSYPHVFESDNEYYMIPESYQDHSIRLYKSLAFPDQWEYQGNLMEGLRTVDSSIFRHSGKWYIFTTPHGGSEYLNIFFADSLNGEWHSHPMNPIIERDARYARPAGRVINYDGRLFRLAQDGSTIYGKRVFVFEIELLTDNDYREKLISKDVLVGPSGIGWNAIGMHHVDLHQAGDRFIAVVDGRGALDVEDESN